MDVRSKQWIFILLCRNFFMVETSIVLIDSQNVFRAWGECSKQRDIHARINYKKLVDRLSVDTNLLRAYFYDGVEENMATKKKNFLEALTYQGIQLRTKILKERTNKCPHCGKDQVRQVQKGVDVSLATDILRHAWQQTCQICIVVSGDEDYKDAIDVAKDKGVKVWIASFKSCLSNGLRRSADKVVYLDDIYDEIKM